MGSRVKRTRAGNTWTEARYFSFIRSALRQASGRYPVKTHVKMEARRNKPDGVEGRHRFEYQCKKCGVWSPDKDVSVDHIIPAGSLKKYSDLPGFVERLFCEADNLQVLCNTCHHTKTQDERKNR